MTVLQTKNKIHRLFPLHLLGQQIVNMPIQKQLQLNIFLTTKSQAFKKVGQEWFQFIDLI